MSRTVIGLDTAKRLAAAFRATPDTDSYETRLHCAAHRASRGSSVVYQDWHVAQAVLIAYESAVRELCALELPFAAHNAEVLEIIRRRNALLAAIGGAS